ncbi:MAG: hypothetical protein R3F30_01230 [Planctomycetota bacterium]
MTGYEEIRGEERFTEFEFGEEGSPIQLHQVPAGTYECRVEDARSGTTRSGDPRWGLKYVVAAGPETGRIAAWDDVVFSERAAPRTRQVLAALGLPCTGRVRLSARDFLGRRAWVRVEVHEYRQPDTGLTIERTRVPYDGIRPLDDGPTPGGDEGAGDGSG